MRVGVLLALAFCVGLVCDVTAKGRTVKLTITGGDSPGDESVARRRAPYSGVPRN